MESAPTTDAVYQSVFILYNNHDTIEQEKASKWLEELQKSVYSWSIADELLQQKRDLQSCYFAAQTMRNKIQNSFHELPPSAHESLRDSLLAHISQITKDTHPIIVTQLCLALADLSLLMSSWRNPVINLIERFSANANSIWNLLIILTFIPEEINSRYLRLGANRREEFHKELEMDSRTVLEFLSACLTNSNQDPSIQMRVIQCFTSWLSIHAIPLCDISDNIILGLSFNLLSSHDTSSRLIDVAAECLCTLLQCLESNNNHQLLEIQVFNGILALEDAYHKSLAYENMDKTVTYSRLFTVMGESFLEKLLAESEQTPHYAIKSLDLILNCVGHYDYEVAEITFNLWYRLSEELYQRNNDQLTNHFTPYIERLIGALLRHSQMEPDHEGLIEDGDHFFDFRRKVSELLKDVVFIVGSSKCFKQMFISLQDPTVTWEGSEAALFIMATVAKNILPDENEVVPKVVEAILNLPENTHIAVRYTSVMLLGELCEWIDRHPESLQAVLNFLLYSLQQKSGLAPAAATALQSICSACKDHMTCHLVGLIQIANSLDSFEISNESAIGLLKGISIIISRLNNKEQLTSSLQTICSFQLTPLCLLVESNVKVERGQRSDPAFWLDRLAAVLRHTNPHVRENEIHPMLSVIKEIWPIISNIFMKYQADLRIMERTCRCVRYAIRCVGKQAAPLLEPLVKQMVHLYALYQHPCFLYLGSVLVDEFAKNSACTQGLLDMLQAFIEPTFNILQIDNGLKNHPDTVDDFFRLCARYLQRSPIEFLQSPIVAPILQCALLACALDHHDANISVMKFFCNLLHCGRPEMNELMRHLVHQIIEMNGEALVMNLIHASVFCLQTYMLSDVADVLIELKVIDCEKFNHFLKNALDVLPKKNSGGCITVTQAQLNEFHESIVRSETTKAVTHALKEFARLYR